MSEGGNLVERKCPVCGKIFVPAPEHVYIEDQKGFCKWSCLCEYRKRKEAAKEKRRATHKHRRRFTREQREEILRMIIDDHKTQKEVSEELGIRYMTIASWMQAYREGRLKL